MRPRRSGFRWLMRKQGPDGLWLQPRKCTGRPGVHLKGSEMKGDEQAAAGGVYSGASSPMLLLECRPGPAWTPGWPGVGRGSVGLSAEGP